MNSWREAVWTAACVFWRRGVNKFLSFARVIENIHAIHFERHAVTSRVDGVVGVDGVDGDVQHLGVP